MSIYLGIMIKERSMRLNILRKQIDLIDYKILKLIGKRLRLVGKISQLKNRKKLPIGDKKRETEILSLISHQSKETSIPVLFARTLFKIIIKGSRKLQQKS